ncbi:MAG: Protein GrpE [Candidatus Levybacteria bacterium GW2011_GWA2_40_8]|nr:MAG: Protein GrpE [Candidatus Levybacteria bacterium GW2011_GWA2_40_8]
MKKHDEKFDKKEKDLENALRRALADYQNLEKRIAEEKSSWVRSANKDLILRLLPGLDSLLLAEKHTDDEGVKVSIDHFLDIFRKEGVEKIETIGREFNPNLMEAISTREGEEGIVLEEIKVGYMLKGEVIRPAQVVVGKETN